MRIPFLLALAIAGLARSASLDDILVRMDTAARAFKSYSADVKIIEYENVIDEKIPSEGSMRLQRGKNGVSGIVDFNSGPNPSIIHIDGPKVQKYFPKANEIQESNLRKYTATLDQMMLLGFSTTREELQRDYDVKVGSAAKVGSIQTTSIVLTPKSAETIKSIKTIELWIPDGEGYPIQEKETSPNKDYKLATYSNLHLNPNLPPSAFELPPEAAKAKRTKLN
jgi:outer membrane lipoprotein-sorting protein